uniref:Uncharacterized protein n=1 Tax=Heterorhabditis bacteriophora TaxID=37862 RepID=A0A1I7XRH8_HETBA
MFCPTSRARDISPNQRLRIMAFAGPERESGAGGEEIGKLDVQFKMLINVLIRLRHWTMPLMLQGSRRLLKGSIE